MITNIDVVIQDDLFSANDILSLIRTASNTADLAGIRFMTRAGAGESRNEMRRRCFDFAAERLRVTSPQLEFWLFACHSLSQERNRISLYRKLWKSLEAANVELPTGERSSEVQVESADGIRFFGSVHVPVQELARAYDVLEVASDSFLIGSVTGAAPALDDSFLQVWTHRSSELTSLAMLAGVVCAGGGILFRPFGFFDDVEVGVDVILEAAYLKEWRLIME